MKDFSSCGVFTHRIVETVQSGSGLPTPMKGGHALNYTGMPFSIAFPAPQRTRWRQG